MSELTFTPKCQKLFTTKWQPVSAGSFFFPTPTQFRFEENWFGVFGFHGTMIVTQCESLCAWSRRIDRNELICSRSFEWFGKSAMTRGNWLGWGRGDGSMTSMVPKTN